jgi:hypothetical protein
MKIAVFWDVTPRDSYKNRRFGRMYHLHLRSVLRLLVTANIVSSSPTFHPDGGGDRFLQNVGSYKSHMT